MRSKTSFFNGTLFRKNLTRFWPLWGGASLLGALAPLAMLMQLIQSRFRVRLEAPEVADAYYTILTGVVPILCLLYAVVCALAVWSYLYNARSVGLMHTLPLSRRGLFVTNVLSGLAMLLIPFAVTGALCVVVTAMAGSIAPAALAVTILCVLGECLFYFASATLVAFVTGHGVAMAALYFVFHFLAVGVEYLLRSLASGFYFGVTADPATVSKWLSPTMALLQKVSYHAEYQEIHELGNVIRTKLSGVYLENAWIIGLYALVGVGMLVLAWLLYSRRRSESAGDVVAVGWMKPVFRYGCALCAALAGGMALYSIFWSSYQEGNRYDALPMGICMVIAGVLGFYVASMLLAKSLRIFRSTWKGAAGTAVAAAVLCGVVGLDVLGVEDRVPSAGEVGSVYVIMDNVSGRFFEESEVQKIIEGHQAVLAEKAEFLANENRGYWEDGWYKTSFQLNYLLKDGRSLSRSYYIDYYRDDPENPACAIGRLAALAVDPAIQRANLLRDDIDRFTGGEIDCWLPASQEQGYTAIDAEQARALYEAIQRDIEAGHFGKIAFREDLWNQKVYYGNLSLYYQTTPVPEEDNASYSRNLTLTLSVYCTETLDALRELGIVDEEHQLLTNEEMNRLEERLYRGDRAYTEVIETVPGHVRQAFDDQEEVVYYEGSAGSLGVIGGADGPTGIYAG